jgi:hypothetical protein
MIAVTAQEILRQDHDELSESAVVVDAPTGATDRSSDVCLATVGGEQATTVETIELRLDLNRSTDQPAAVASASEQPDSPAAHAVAWLAFESFAIAIP